MLRDTEPFSSTFSHARPEYDVREEDVDCGRPSGKPKKALLDPVIGACLAIDMNQHLPSAKSSNIFESSIHVSSAHPVNGEQACTRNPESHTPPIGPLAQQGEPFATSSVLSSLCVQGSRFGSSPLLTWVGHHSAVVSTTLPLEPSSTGANLTHSDSLKAPAHMQSTRKAGGTAFDLLQHAAGR